MVSLAFHLFVDGTVIFLLSALMTVVVHSFVADSIYIRLVVWWCFCVCVFSTLCLQVGNHLEF